MKGKKTLPSIEIRSGEGAAPRLVVRGEEKVDVEAGDVQSIGVERFEAPLDIRYRGVRVGPRTTGRYAVVARVAGRAVRLATFPWPARAMFVAAELQSALGVDCVATRQRVAVVDPIAAGVATEAEFEGDASAETEAQAESEVAADKRSRSL